MQSQDESMLTATKGSLKPFKPPRKTRKAIDVTSDSTSSTEEEMDLEESIFRQEARDWLATFAPKLVALETAKHLTQEARRKDLKSRR